MILEELMLDLMYNLPNNKRVRDLPPCLLEKAG
jgi:ATP-dependent protease Clp ATPase subunit